jgi:acyl-coenzyme A synthetase/AMP-(fatty) acid ligase
MAWVNAQVARHKRIREVRLVEEIPRTPSGKILRRALRERIAPALTAVSGRSGTSA